ncbi:hypothetical protein GCM10009838_31330 [Catenulispora subtropica]|uniref:Uncharacterized protein n=1 Tax=Catenulispora subtropica TaxID=450798 RepID=A0ABN2RJH1_9ACTN
MNEHTVGVEEAGGGFSNAPFLGPASDDVDFDAGPGFGEFVGQADDAFEALVADQAAHGDQAGESVVSPHRS